MSKKLVLVSHGLFCEELKKTAEMVMGPQENIFAIPLLAEEDAAKFSDKFNNLTKDFDDFVVFADLFGGTPCNAATNLILKGKKIEVITGMNLPMVIEFINEDTGNYKEAAIEGIVDVNEALSSLDDEDDE